MERQSVKLYIYDLTSSGGSGGSSGGRGGSSGGIPGIRHTGVVVYGKEFTFNNKYGIHITEPGTPREIEHHGRTKISEEDFMKFITSMKEYTVENYSLLSRNCVHFCSEVLKYLTNSDVPKRIKEQPERAERCLLKILLGFSVVVAIAIIRVVNKK